MYTYYTTGLIKLGHSFQSLQPIFHCNAKYLASGNAPDARILHWRYQHVGIFWRYLTLKFAFSATPTPDASQWNIGCVGSQRKMLAMAMYISCFLCRFHLRLVPKANPISSGAYHCITYSMSELHTCPRSAYYVDNLVATSLMQV